MMDDIDEEKWTLVSDKDASTTQLWVNFYNEETAQSFEEFEESRGSNDNRVFQISKQLVNRKFRHVSRETGMTVQRLCRWLGTETLRCGSEVHRRVL